MRLTISLSVVLALLSVVVALPTYVSIANCYAVELTSFNSLDSRDMTLERRNDPAKIPAQGGRELHQLPR